MHDGDRWCAVVMPCLNEESYLRAACASLGFEIGRRPPSSCYLILVDNGSTDATLDICYDLRAEFGRLVTVLQEPVRGHVPARHRGNVAAAHLAAADGIPSTEAIVVQVDADTHYSDRYVEIVRDKLPITGGELAQAATAYPPDFASLYPRVFEAVDSVDRSIERRFAPYQGDVVVDDKACSYTLSDYFDWGGHRREYFTDGSEILAETTRLMIAALAAGAKRKDIDEASAIHSQRRLLSDAAQELSSAGFPYAGRRIVDRTGRITLDHLEAIVAAGQVEVLHSICAARARHLVALLVLLPAHVTRTMSGALPSERVVRDVLNGLPRRTVEETVRSPGRLVNDVLRLAWWPDPLVRLLAP